MSIVIDFLALVALVLALVALVLVGGWLLADSEAVRQWAEPNEGLMDLEPLPEEEDWWQQAEAMAEREHVERIDLSRLKEVD